MKQHKIQKKRKHKEAWKQQIQMIINKYEEQTGLNKKNKEQTRKQTKQRQINIQINRVNVFPALLGPGAVTRLVVHRATSHRAGCLPVLLLRGQSEFARNKFISGFFSHFVNVCKIPKIVLDALDFSYVNFINANTWTISGQFQVSVKSYPANTLISEEKKIIKKKITQIQIWKKKRIIQSYKEILRTTKTSNTINSKSSWKNKTKNQDTNQTHINLKETQSKIKTTRNDKYIWNTINKTISKQATYK